jgi:hypothetical protein
VRDERAHQAEQAADGDEPLQLLGELEESLALIHIWAARAGAAALDRAARRIRQQIRADDLMLLLEHECAIVLRRASLAGAEAVAGRIAPLLADVEHEWRTLAGESARRLLAELQRKQPRILPPGRSAPSASTEAMVTPSEALEEERLPYLAFLSSYPSIRLLHLIPYELANHYRCVPIGAERGTLTLATCRRLDRAALDHLQTVTQRAIFQVRCEPEIIADILRYWQQQQRRYFSAHEGGQAPLS